MLIVYDPAEPKNLREDKILPAAGDAFAPYVGRVEQEETGKYGLRAVVRDGPLSSLARIVATAPIMRDGSVGAIDCSRLGTPEEAEAVSDAMSALEWKIKAYLRVRDSPEQTFLIYRTSTPGPRISRQYGEDQPIEVACPVEGAYPFRWDGAAYWAFDLYTGHLDYLKRLQDFAGSMLIIAWPKKDTEYVGSTMRGDGIPGFPIIEILDARRD